MEKLSIDRSAIIAVRVIKRIDLYGQYTIIKRKMFAINADLNLNTLKCSMCFILMVCLRTVGIVIYERYVQTAKEYCKKKGQDGNKEI